MLVRLELLLAVFAVAIGAAGARSTQGALQSKGLKKLARTASTATSRKSNLQTGSTPNAAAMAPEQLEDPDSRTVLTRTFVMQSRTKVEAEGNTVTTAFFAPPATQPGTKSFLEFVQGTDFVPFMRSVVATIEKPTTEGGLGLPVDYGIRVAAIGEDSASFNGDLAASRSIIKKSVFVAIDQSEVAVAASACGFVVVVMGDTSRNTQAPVTGLSEDNLDKVVAYKDNSDNNVDPGITLRDVMVAEGPLTAEGPLPLTRVFRDFQGRAIYVGQLTRFVSRLTELTDPELRELWLQGTELAAEIGWMQIDMNAGGFQNVAHVHVKWWLDEKKFVKTWSEDPIYKKLVAYRIAAIAAKKGAKAPTNPANDSAGQPASLRGQGKLITQ